jgi:hypothetical protein
MLHDQNFTVDPEAFAELFGLELDDFEEQQTPRELIIPTPRWAEPLHATETTAGEIVRYRGAHGGRGGGKSQEFAGMIIEEMIADPDCSIVCIREIQKSLARSAKKVIEAKIIEFGYQHLFRVLKTHIERIGGTGVCIFQGMQDHTADSVKSLEGMKIAWVEEAQSLSQRSMDLLRPTIREEGSQIWFSWNPRRRGDPVEKLLRGNKGLRADSIVVQVNYDQNPFLPLTLLKEAETDLVINPEGFPHTWLGDYEDVGSKVVIPTLWVRAAIGLADDLGIDVTGQDYGALDVAGAEDGGDENAFAHRKGIELQSVEVWNGLDTSETTTKTVLLGSTKNIFEIYYDSVGVGEGVLAEWARLGRQKEQPAGMEFYPWSGGAGVLDPDKKIEEGQDHSPLNKNQYMNLKAQGWFALRKRFENAYKARKGLPYDAEMLISLPRDLTNLLQIEEELTQPHQKTSGTGKTMVDKQPDGAKSPNLADAIMMVYFPCKAALQMAGVILRKKNR